MKTPEIDRFWWHVEFVGECWMWRASASHVVPKFWTDNGLLSARQWAWKHIHRKPTDGKVLTPTCGNRRCVNPNHLRLVGRDMLVGDLNALRITGPKNGPKRRDWKYHRGEDHPSSKLTWPLVREVRRRAATESVASIASDIGRSPNTLYKVVNGTTWKEPQCPISP